MVAAKAYRISDPPDRGGPPVRPCTVTTERELVERARCGDREALGTLLSRHERKMYALALRYTGDPDLARDALQDSYVRVLLCLHQLRANSRFSAWMARIVINATRLRHRTNRRFIALDSVPEPKHGCSDNGIDPERWFAAHQVLHQVDDFLRETRTGDHQLFVSRFIDGQTIKDISAKTGLSIPVIKTRIHRARKQLAIRFSPEERALLPT